MNAYELADIIADPHRATYPYHLDIADMLRQQADRIAELEKSAEPVAWIKKDTLIFLGNYEFGSITIQVQKQKDDEFDIPLYTTPQIKERCEPLCKPSVCNCIKKQLNDAIKIIEELRVDADMNYKDYENTYADGWDDAFNNILSALYERHEIK